MNLNEHDRRMPKKVYCIRCGRNRPYKIKIDTVEIDIDPGCFVYIEKTAYCKWCGYEVYVPEINDENVAARLQAHESVKMMAQRNI